MQNKLKPLALLLGAALLCAPAMTKEKAAPAGAMDPEMMKKWEAYSTPGEAHKALSPLVGSFTTSLKCWMTPGSQPELSSGTSDSQWILGGRFIESVVKGTSMGKPFEGRGYMGYDNEKKQYDGVWLDNMATGMMTTHGQYDAATKTLNEMGSASCPLEGTKSFRCVTKIINDNTHTYTMYTNDKDGKEFLMMEITYVRKS